MLIGMHTSSIILVAIVTFVVLEYAFWAAVNFLNERSKNQPLSPQGAEIFNSDEYSKSMAYDSARFRLELFTKTISTAVSLLAITLGWFALLDEKLRSRIDSGLLVTVSFVGLLIILMAVVKLPINYYSTFVIEEEFGFNKSTKGLFFADSIKQLVLSLLLGLPLLYAVAWIYDSLRNQFWLVAWGLFSAVSLFIFVFGARIFLPMFNKLKPLPDGELRSAVEEYCQTQGFPLSKLYEMDASKRSTKLNAFFSGMGKVKIIGLFDTLIEKLSVQETVAVLAHEVGHYKRKHVYSMFAFSSAQTLIIFSLMGWLLGNSDLSKALGAEQPSFHLALLAFLLLFTPISTVSELLGNWLSRRNEYEADQYAIETYPGSREFMDSALKKLAVESLTNLNPHPLYVAVNFTHPPILARLAALQRQL